MLVVEGSNVILGQKMQKMIDLIASEQVKSTILLIKGGYQIIDVREA
jgi:hypothetical protein